MKARHLEFLVEEPSMEAFLRELLPRLLAQQATFEIYPYQGKHDLLSKLGTRLRGYAAWLPDDWRIVVLLDCDDLDCDALKRQMERAAADVALSTRTAFHGSSWQVVNRIAIEELEAWYFGDWHAVRRQYPRVPATIPRRAAYRDPDAIAGGTW